MSRETIPTARPTEPPVSPSGKRLSAAERKLLDDLRVHEIELQMQNQELIHAKADLERSRARYFDLYDFAPVGYFTLSPPRGSIDGLNLAAAELLRVDRQRAVGTPLASYFDESSRGAFRAHLDAVFEATETRMLDVRLADHASNPRRHLHIVSRPIRGEAGDRPLCLSAAINVTERKLAEEERGRLHETLQQRNQRLEELNKDLEAFVYSISHDLRAPLRNMAGFASIIADEYHGKLPPEVHDYARRIVAANEKMLLLVDDLLRFSRLGRKALELVATDLNALLDEVVASLEAEAKGREVQWRRQPLPIVECDRALMRQVFVNLLSNALKYSRPRRPAIITVGTDVRNAERVIFVRDNGVGFDMRYRDKLFGVFQRLHVGSEFEGNGVGLAMVARILARHNGRALAEARLDQGATFWFTFEGLKKAV